MKIDAKVNIHNRFDIEVRDAITGELKQEAVAYNIVLDQMYTRLCGGSSYFVNIHFGTGTGVPTPDRTSLFTHLGTRAAVNEELVKAFPLSLWKRKIVLNPEEYVGSVITEVGVAFGTANTNLVTHALLKDAEGNVISINKTDTDVVNIYATVYVSFSENDPSIFLLNVGNADNALINWLIGGAGSPTGSFNLLSGEGYGGVIATSGVVTWISDVGNKQRKTNIQRFPISVNGHVAGFDFERLFSVKFPAAGIHSGQPYIGVAVGVGDGIKREFTLPSRNIFQNSISLLLEGVNTTAYTTHLSKLNNFMITKPSIIPPNTPTSVALSADGLVLAIAHSNSPHITTYDWNGSAWIKKTNPVEPPSPDTGGIALSADGSVLAVGSTTLPYITTYDWGSSAWIKRPNPDVLPPGTSNAIALSDDGLIMAIGHVSSPFITTYDWNGSMWIKRPNPDVLPTNAGLGVSLSDDGLVMAVAYGSAPYTITYDWNGSMWIKRPTPVEVSPAWGNGISLSADGSLMAVVAVSSPYITTYDWNGSMWIKRPNPDVLPTGAGYGVSLSDDGLVMAVVHSISPFITTYDWNGSMWIKRPNPDVLPTGNSNAIALSDGGSVIAVVHSGGPYIATYDGKARTTKIIFDTPPAAGKAITANYTTSGVHKTDQYVIDISFTIQFGEGV